MNDLTEEIELSVVKGPTSGLFTINPLTGVIKIAPDVTREQFREILRMAKTMHHKSEVALAGIIRYGVIAFGVDEVNQDLEQLEFQNIFVKSALAINSIPEELLLPNLDGEHYVELARAKVSKEQQLHWGRIANDQCLSPMQLRLSIKEGEVIDPAAVKALKHGVITIQGIHQTFSVWLRRVGGINGVAKMDSDHKEEILGEINEIVDFGLALRSILTPAQVE